MHSFGVQVHLHSIYHNRTHAALFSFPNITKAAFFLKMYGSYYTISWLHSDQLASDSIIGLNESSFLIGS